LTPQDASNLIRRIDSDWPSPLRYGPIRRFVRYVRLLCRLQAIDREMNAAILEDRNDDYAALSLERPHIQRKLDYFN
jgi:hypothetical protein